MAAGRRFVTATSTVQWVGARFLADGSADPTFNGNGRSQPLTTDIADSPLAAGALGVAVQPDGNILVVGQSTGIAAPIQVVKIDGDGVGSDGSVVTSGFGTLGIAAIAVPGSTRTNGEAIAIQPDGRILVAGHAFIGGHETVFVARLKSDGTPDDTFDNPVGGGSGVVYVPAGSCDAASNPAPDCLAESLAFTSTGGQVDAIYVGGYNGQATIGGRVWKLTPSSGADGFALAPNWGDPSLPGAAVLDRTFVNEVDQVLPQINGNVVVGGYAQSGTSFQCGIARLTPLGTADTSFGTAGAGRINIGGTCIPRDLVQQDDGRFLFTGQDYSGSFFAGDESTVIGRFAANGQPDESFAPGGAVILDPGGAPSDGQAVALQEGAPLIAGFAGNPAVFRLARFAGGDIGMGGGPGPGPGPVAVAPLNLTPPNIMGRMEVGSAIYCAPGAWSNAASFQYEWGRIEVDASATPLATGQVYVPTDLDSGHKLRCTVTALGAGGAQRRAEASNEPTVVFQAGIVPFPAVSLAMPRVIQQATKRVCRSGVCKPEQVLEYLRDKGVPVTYNEVQEDPSAFPSYVEDISAGMVFKQSPAPGRPIKSINGTPVKVTLTVYQPVQKLRHCPIDRPINAGGDTYTMAEALKGQSLQMAESSLKLFGCVRFNSKSGDEANADYALDLRPDKGVFDAVVTGSHFRTVGGNKIIVLEVRYPADQLAFVVSPDPAPGVLTLSLGTPTLTVDTKNLNRFVVAPQTGTNIGFKNAFVELRDENGQQLDGAYTGADGTARLKALIDHPGAYTILSRISDRNGETLTGVQDIRAVDRKDAPWISAGGTSFTGSATAGYKATAFVAAAFTARQEDATRAALEPYFQSIDVALRLPNNHLTKDQRDVLDILAVNSDGYRAGAITYAEFVRRGFSPTSVALGGSGTLTAATVPVVATPGVVSDGSKQRLQMTNSIQPGNGVLVLRYAPAGHPAVLIYPSGLYTFEQPGGQLLRGGTSPVPVVVDASSRLLNISPIIGNDGASLITNDGASLIGNDGASLIGNDGASLITNDGGSFTASQLLSEHGAGIVAQGGGNIVAQGGGNFVVAGSTSAGG